MSLVSTLAKMAIGIAVAKGVSSLAKAGRGQSAGGRMPQSGSAGGGLGDMMGEILGGGRGSAGNGPSGSGGGLGGGSLGGMFDQLPDTATKKTSGKNRANAPTSIDDMLGSGRSGGGGLGDLLGGMLGGASTGGRTAGGRSVGGAQGGGGIGDLLGAVLGGTAASRGSGGLGDMLNKALTGKATAQEEPSQAQELSAGLMLKCMIQAVKCDGALDADEKQKLMSQLGDATEAEMKFVNAELAAPLDIEGLAKQIPQGLEAQAYMMSLMAINLDNRNEAQYLNSLAQALDLEKEQVNAVHDHVKAPRLYS